MVNNDLQVTERAIRAHNLCVRKAYLLLFSPSLSSPNSYENMQGKLSNISRQNYFRSISNQLIVQPFSPLALSKGVDILTSVNLSVDFLSIKNITLIKVPDVLHLDEPHYEPIIFSSANKIQPEDKIKLAFIGYTLSKFLNYLPKNGHVVLVDGRVITVKMPEGIHKYLPSINSIQEDSLSLLGGMTKKQILKFEKKGIFTVKQLSFLYRHARRDDAHVRNALPINLNFKRSH